MLPVLAAAGGKEQISVSVNPQMLSVQANQSPLTSVAAAVQDFIVRAGLDRCEFEPEALLLDDRSASGYPAGSDLQLAILDEKWQMMACVQFQSVKIIVEGNENSGYKVVGTLETGV